MYISFFFRHYFDIINMMNDGDNMNLITIIIGIIFFLSLIQGVAQSGPLAIIVLLFIIISSLKNNKKNKRKKKKKTTKKVKNKINKSNQIFKEIEIPSNKNLKYSNEKFNQTEDFIHNKQKLIQIRQMQAMANINLNKQNDYSKEKSFYLQGNFMVDYIDQYDTNITCNQSSPTYNDLNVYQLRSFFSWRTQVRNGIYNQTEKPYVLLYIYELINQIGVKNSIDGLNKIIELWQNYRKFDNTIDKYLNIWIKDYYIINNININYNLIKEELPNDEIIDEILLGNYENKLNYFDQNSNYHILKSKIMEHKYSFLVNMIIPNILKNLDKYLHQFNYSLNDILFGRIKKTNWQPFDKAIYYHNPLTKDFVFNFNNHEKYYKIQKNYLKETFVISDYSKDLMGYILKNLDITLRECLKINGNLKINENMLDQIKDNQNLYQIINTKNFTDIISITTKKYLIENKTKINNYLTDKNKKNIIIDSKQFESIRASSNRVQEKLIIEEEPANNEIKEEIITKYTNNSNDIFTNLIDNLNKLEIEFISMIISLKTKQELINFCKQNNILYEIMIENINSKALEIIGDNLLEDYEEEIIIYAEYIDSIKEKIQGGK